ncbi:MAG: UDP-3-O-(3-hydroxymyristoyl)glucosamine N-acyltransferase [Cyanobacteriota bacterium]|jgi:UDP-3-O-[3-hydroxymyristoyl] glucosamine N-acyltransferase|nr:UDP-3-O-(3-hydroxymyristoyl)glucosamine N-acyltransferase [Cyanobacteriota bacterium]
MRFSELIESLPSISNSAARELAGDPAIDSAAPMNRAAPGQITFYESAAGDAIVAGTQPSALILPTGNLHLKTSASSHGIAWVESDYPKLTFAEVLERIHPEDPVEPGIHRAAEIHPTAELGADVSIGPFAVIGAHCRIGDRCCIHPGAILHAFVEVDAESEIHSGVVIHRRTVIGQRCVIHANAVVGSEGFGFIPTAGGLRKMPQTGRVVLEDQVELGCNTCVDRPAMGETRIGTGTKIDNLVQIGHGVQVGSHCALASQVGIAGGASLGNNVVLGGQVGVADKISLGDGMKAYASAAIPGNVASGEVVCGVPAIPARQFIRSATVFKSLPEMMKSLKRLEKQVSAQPATQQLPASSEPEA